jgi:ABC-type nitrate/sulfonate/bicarbonate transport system substrate-binding protein
MGHNQPPGPIDESALGPDIEAAARQIKSELESDTPDASAVGRAGAFLAWAGKILQIAKQEGAKVLEKGKDLAREYMAKALWGTAGTLGATFKEELVDLLRRLAGSILNWLQHISIL